jgi:hypothetical protein
MAGGARRWDEMTAAAGAAMVGALERETAPAVDGARPRPWRVGWLVLLALPVLLVLSLAFVMRT